MDPEPPPLPVNATAEPTATPPPFIPLHPRVVDLWRLQHLISSFILLAFCLVGVGVLAFQYGPALPWAAGAWVLLAVTRAILLFWYPRRAYFSWGYRLDGHVLETMNGVWFRTITLLPLSRLQHVDLDRGPMERMFGLASLTVYTAGTHHATVAIPGLEANDAARLRDQLGALGAEKESDGI